MIIDEIENKLRNFYVFHFKLTSTAVGSSKFFFQLQIEFDFGFCQVFFRLKLYKIIYVDLFCFRFDSK